MEKDFLKLPLAIQMAIVSFGIGTLLLLLHFIFKKSDINELKTYLENINFKTILDDGKQKVEQNQTSLDEVYKVACF